MCVSCFAPQGPGFHGTAVAISVLSHTMVLSCHSVNQDGSLSPYFFAVSTFLADAYSLYVTVT